MAERHDRLCHASASDGQSVLVVARPATPLVGRYSRTHAGAFRGRLASNSLSSAVRGAHIVPPPVAEGVGTRGFLRARLSGDRAVLEIGRASGGERVCQSVEISVVAGDIKKKT